MLATAPPPVDSAAGQTTILVVDDTPLDRRLAGRVLEKQPGLAVGYAADGQEALDVLARATPAAIVTDLQMPGMDGLQLVEEVRARFPHVPVLLMTGHGSEDVAIQALRRGAASYVPKRSLARELVPAVLRLVAAARETSCTRRLEQSLTRAEFELSLDNDPVLVAQLVTYAQDQLARMGLGDETGRIRIGVALHEALTNALFHGNLELNVNVDSLGWAAVQELVRQRRAIAPYGDRRIHVVVRITPGEARFVVRDGGPGFDTAALPDPNDPSTLERPIGKGLVLIRTFMD